MILSKWMAVSAFGLAMFTAGSSASALTIDFDNHPEDFENDIVDSGFVFHYDALGWGITFGDTFTGPGFPIVSNGTTFSIMSGARNGDSARVLFKPIDDAAFSMSQLDAATDFFGDNGGMEVIGNLEGGGTVSATFELDDAFATFVLPDTFVNLDSVMIRNTITGDFLDDRGVSIDNLVVTPVPEPATLAALGIALVGLAKRKRR